MALQSITNSPIVRSLDQACMRIAPLGAARRHVEGLWETISASDERRRKVLLCSGLGTGVVVIGLGIGGYFMFRPMPKPDYENDSIYRVFKYTMLTDEFNKLSVEERLRLLGMVRERLENMSKSESLLLGAFASGIAGQTREQLEENVSRLVIDTWDMHAVDYADVPIDDREAYVDGIFIELHEMMETLGGDANGKTADERLAEGRQQAQRDAEMVQEGNGPSSRALARISRILNDGVGGHASPQQKVRGQLLMRDMTRRLRGQPLSGGG